VSEVGVSIIPLAGIALPLFLVPTIMLLKQGHQKRHWRHLERMQALAAGVPVPPLSSPPGTAAVIAIGAGVPICSVFAAMIATLNMHRYTPDGPAQIAIVWAFALIVSMGALTTSLILAVLQNRAHARAASSFADAAFDSSKPTYDPDAFDVVSRRG
jgi:hypothetical protein